MSELKIDLSITKYSYMALLKFSVNPMSRLTKKRQKSEMAPASIKKKKLTSNPIIKCDMSFLTFFWAWNLLLDFKLQCQNMITIGYSEIQFLLIVQYIVTCDVIIFVALVSIMSFYRHQFYTINIRCSVSFRCIW